MGGHEKLKGFYMIAISMIEMLDTHEVVMETIVLLLGKKREFQLEVPGKHKEKKKKSGSKNEGKKIRLDFE